VRLHDALPDDDSPRREDVAPGVVRIADVFDADAIGGVDTLEGRIGSLLVAEDAQSHFIEMPAGLFVEEHPHSVGSIIFTARGRWVLCSNGERVVMETGSLFLFEDEVDTGYEVPFDEPAFLLIFKDVRGIDSDGSFADYLRDMAARLESAHEQGTPFRFTDLEPDHPALAFARDVPGAVLPVAGAAARS
jgi:hypothetical protein